MTIALLLTGLIEITFSAKIASLTTCKLNSDCTMSGRLCNVDSSSKPQFKCLLALNQKCSTSMDCANNMTCMNNNTCSCPVYIKNLI